MASSRELWYWDSDVILSYLNKETPRHKDLSQMLAEVENSSGKIKIISSTIAKVEVAYLKENEVPDTSQQALDKIDQFFLDSSVIELVGVNDYITDLAREFIVDIKSRGMKLTPADAIHMATAKWMGVTVFHTYNERDFKRLQHKVQFDIEQPLPQQTTLFVIPPRSP